MGEAAQADYPKHETGISYAGHSALNTLQTTIVRPFKKTQDSLFIVYIHGGAWRDPAIDATSFAKLESLLLKHESIKHVAGLASMNYRLSPYPSHPTDPSNPADPARNVKHPDHINDVLAAILYLQDKYCFEERYILVGHSCGATLAMQVAMKRYYGKQYESTFATELNVVPPLAIVGVEGIYDIPQLLKTYKHEPAYLDFISNAFGNNSFTWSEVSPARADFKVSWQEGQLVYLVHSTDDELVDVGQRDLMHETLIQQGWSTHSGQEVVSYNLEGQKHDEVWEKPDKLAACIGELIIKAAKHVLLT